jgi:replication-associated recombination protein RarA
MRQTVDISLIPPGDRKRMRDDLIRKLYNKGNGHTLDQICAMSRKNPEMFYGSSGLGKTTVYFAVNGRTVKKR